jgi:hypothetical protein
LTRESREFRKAMAGRPTVQEMQVAEALERQRIAAVVQEDAHIIARSNSAFSFFAQLKQGDIEADLYDKMAESAQKFLCSLWDDGVAEIEARRASASVVEPAENP